MISEDKEIKYWAGMLDEAFQDEYGTIDGVDEGNASDVGPGDREFAEPNLSEADIEEMTKEALEAADLDETDLSNLEGTMTKLIADKIMGPMSGCKTVQDVYNLCDSTFKEAGLDTPASRRLLMNVQRSRSLLQAMQTVAWSYNAGKMGKIKRSNRSEY